MEKGYTKFDWNFTVTRNHSNITLRGLGLVAVHANSYKIWELSVHEKLGIATTSGILNDQKGNLIARNDFHSLSIPITLVVKGGNSDGGIAGWAIALIVIGSLAVAAGAGYFGYMKFFAGKAPNRESEAEKSLLEREADEDEKDGDDDSDD